MDLIYVVCPAVGTFFGVLYGSMINSRAFVAVGGADWVPTYAVLGALWGLSGAAMYRSAHKKEEDSEKGELLTETKAYKKKNARKKDEKKEKEEPFDGP